MTLAEHLQAQRERLAALEGQRVTLREEAEALGERRLQLAPLAHVDCDVKAQRDLKKATARILEIDGEVAELHIAIADLNKRISRTEADIEKARRQDIAREILVMLDAQGTDGQAFEDGCAAAAAALARLEVRTKDLNHKAREISVEHGNAFSTRGLGLTGYAARRLCAHFKPHGVTELVEPLSGRTLGQLLTDARGTYEKLAAGD